MLNIYGCYEGLKRKSVLIYAAREVDSVDPLMLLVILVISQPNKTNPSFIEIKES